MQLTKTNGYLLFQSDATHLYCDPTHYANELDGKLILITHLYPSLFDVLESLSSNTTVLLSLDLLFLLQKLQRFFAYKKFTLSFKILPCSYAVTLGNIHLTAENSDDSLYGSIVVLIQDQQTKIGYAPIFDPHGKHKKRIKKWKKKWSQIHLDLLIIDSSLLNPVDDLHHFTELDNQKKFSSFINKIQPHELAYVRFSPWNPELLLSFNDIALKSNYHIVWPDYWKNFLQSFSPYADLKDTDSIVSGQKLYFSDKVKVTNYYEYYYELPPLLSTISNQEWAEFAKIINAKALKLL